MSPAVAPLPHPAAPLAESEAPPSLPPLLPPPPPPARALQRPSLSGREGWPGCCGPGSARAARSLRGDPSRLCGQSGRGGGGGGGAARKSADQTVASRMHAAEGCCGPGSASMCGSRRLPPQPHPRRVLTTAAARHPSAGAPALPPAVTTRHPSADPAQAARSLDTPPPFLPAQPCLTACGAVQLRAAELLGGHILPCGGLDQGRPAQEDGAVAAAAGWARVGGRWWGRRVGEHSGERETSGEGAGQDDAPLQAGRTSSTPTQQNTTAAAPAGVDVASSKGASPRNGALACHGRHAAASRPA